MLVLSNLNLGKNQLINVVVHVLAQAPSDASEGQLYYNSVDKKMYIYNGEKWLALDPTNPVEHINNGSANININKIDGLTEKLNKKETTQGAQDKANDALNSAKEFATKLVTDLIGGSPEDLNTLKELADAVSKNKDIGKVVQDAISKKTGKYSSFIGDNVAKEFNVVHNLKTKDVVVQVHEKNSPYAVVYTDIDIVDENTTAIKFAVAPTEQQYKVVVIG